MKQVLITGASSGIGRALTLEYLRLGWRVYACGRDGDRLDSLMAELLSRHTLSNDNTLGKAQCEPLIFDVTLREACLDAEAQLEGELDLVILNAGSCEYMDNPQHFDGELFARLIETNLLSLGFCLEAFLPRVHEGGRVALMGSSAAILPLPRAEAYGASKAAVAYLADTLRIHLVSSRIGVSLIEPGFIRTPLTDKNDFSMPGRIEVTDAAKRIVAGLNAGKDTLRFPRRLLWPMVVLSWLPAALWRQLALKLGRSQQPQSNHSPKDGGSL